MTLMSHAVSESPEVIEPAHAVDSEGWVYDITTGEVVGFDGADRFSVETEDDADFALEVRSKVEGRIAGLKARKAALVANLDAQINAEYRRLAYWEFRWWSPLVGFARSRLRGKERTWRGTFGAVSFRKTPGSTKILDDEAAVEFVKTWEPAWVKVVESVTVKAVLAARDQAAAVSGEEVELPFLAVSPPGENVSIETGIEVKGSTP